MMNRPEPARYCKWEGETHPLHRLGDGLGMPGTCGFCGGSADFVLKDGNWVPKRHPARLRPRHRTGGTPQGRMGRHRI
jgi:hypothetical protein